MTEPRALLGCAVHDLAWKYDDLARQWAVEDRADASAIEPCIDLHDRMQEIIEAASHLTPRSKAGAAFQIIAASLQEDGIANGSTPAVRKAARVRQQRLLYRVLEWVGLDDGELLDARVYAMPAQLDPSEVGNREPQKKGY